MKWYQLSCQYHEIRHIGGVLESSWEQNTKMSFGVQFFHGKRREIFCWKIRKIAKPAAPFATQWLECGRELNKTLKCRRLSLDGNLDGWLDLNWDLSLPLKSANLLWRMLHLYVSLATRQKWWLRQVLSLDMHRYWLLWLLLSYLS